MPAPHPPNTCRTYHLHEPKDFRVGEPRHGDAEKGEDSLQRPDGVRRLLEAQGEAPVRIVEPKGAPYDPLDGEAEDTPRERCMPSCPAEIRAQYSSAEALLEAAGVVRDSSWSTLLMNSTFKSTTLTYDDLLDELCHVGYAGEMFTSAAPQDPLFWSVHGNAERFLQALRWYQEEGFISGFDQTWGYEHVASASDTNVVCDWSGVSSSTDMPSCTKGTCPGHKADDTLPFTVSTHSLMSELV